MRHAMSRVGLGLLRISAWRQRVGLRSVTLFGRPPAFENYGKLTFDNGCRFRAVVQRSYFFVGPNASLAVGANAFFNEGVQVHCTRSISIGVNCKFANHVSIMDSNQHQIHEGDDVIAAPVVIGNNVWVGQGAIVLPGVTIGDHAVIGAGSVVTRNIPERGIFVGSPAHLIASVRCSERFARR